MKRSTVIIAIAAALALSSAAFAAATSWKVVATGTGSYASASADIKRANAIGIRAFGKDLVLSGFFSCEIADTRVASGQVITLTVAKAKTCSVHVSGTHGSYETNGDVRVQIVKR